MNFIDKESINRNIKLTLFLTMVASIALIDSCLAISEPTSGSFAYDVYDIGVNKILKGPIGFVAGCSAIAIGAISAFKAQVMTAVPAVLGGAALMKADTIITSLGALF